MKIIVLSFNHPELTSKTIRSVLEFVPAIQILLIHNGSLSQHQKMLQKTFPEIEHLILPLNKGYSGGANAGLKHCFEQGYDWALFLTNDCQLIQLAPPPQNSCLAAPLIWRRKVGKVDSLGAQLNLHKAELRHFVSAEDFKSNTQKFYVPGTAFWIHRDIFQSTQGFDESLGTYWEDVDLCLRLGPENLALAPQTEIIHAVGKTCHKDIHYTTYLFQRNRKRVCLKYSPLFFDRLQVWTSLAWSWSLTMTKLFLKNERSKMKILWNACRD